MTLFNFDNTFAKKMQEFYFSCSPQSVSFPELIYVNADLLNELGGQLSETISSHNLIAEYFSGNRLMPGAQPLAQCYAGHQFGGFSPQLGDGRALLLGEVIDINGNYRDIALKGSGKTPFSRRGDGRAALGPILREVIFGEAMNALGIPTTRALAVTTTGEKINRNGMVPGAVLTRVAESHLRIGTFEYSAAHQSINEVKKLADYAINRHYPSLNVEEHIYTGLLTCVVKKQAQLIAKWMSIGFIHGVMNTDNMCISGETIDYGPCAWMENYQPNAVFSSIDREGRYAYDQQPHIAKWNLARFAETLLPLLQEETDDAIHTATHIVMSFDAFYAEEWLNCFTKKMGLTSSEKTNQIDRNIIQKWLDLLEKYEIDFTLAWLALNEAVAGDLIPLLSLFPVHSPIKNWLDMWEARGCLEHQSVNDRQKQMKQVNPCYVPRNHWIEEVLFQACHNGNFQPFYEWLSILKNPYERKANDTNYFKPASKQFTQSYQTFCGT